MTITLPEEMREPLERKARAAGFATVAEYLCWLATDEADGPPELSPKSAGEIEAMLDAGMASGPPIPVIRIRGKNCRVVEPPA